MVSCFGHISDLPSNELGVDVDGKSLNGWITINKTGQGYLVKNGILICPATGGGNLFSVKEYSNFVLRFEEVTNFKHFPNFQKYS